MCLNLVFEFQLWEMTKFKNSDKFTWSSELPRQQNLVFYLFIPESHRSNISSCPVHQRSTFPFFYFASILLPPIVHEPFNSPIQPPTANDENVDSFITRSFGETFGWVLHRIYSCGILRKEEREALFAAFRKFQDGDKRLRGESTDMNVFWRWWMESL